MVGCFKGTGNRRQAREGAAEGLWAGEFEGALRGEFQRSFFDL